MMDWKGADKRDKKRRHLIYYSEVLDRDSGKLSGRLADITSTGLMLTTEKEIERDRLFHFELMLPAEIKGRDSIKFEAKSLWCKKDVNPDHFIVGFEIEAIDPEERELIADLIDSYGFKD